MFFEVVSVDSWSRCRTEGYGFISLPMKAQNYENILVDTWRPIKHGTQTEMRRYFIGGTPELEDLAYCGTPASSSDEPILSRYGMKTISSGTFCRGAQWGKVYAVMTDSKNVHAGILKKSKALSLRCKNVCHKQK